MQTALIRDPLRFGAECVVEVSTLPVIASRGSSLSNNRFLVIDFYEIFVAGAFRLAPAFDDSGTRSLALSRIVTGDEEHEALQMPSF
jgi:hypothetical protein